MYHFMGMSIYRIENILKTNNAKSTANTLSAWNMNAYHVIASFRLSKNSPFLCSMFTTIRKQMRSRYRMMCTGDCMPTTKSNTEFRICPLRDLGHKRQYFIGENPVWILNSGILSSGPQPTRWMDTVSVTMWRALFIKLMKLCELVRRRRRTIDYPASQKLSRCRRTSIMPSSIFN